MMATAAGPAVVVEVSGSSTGSSSSSSDTSSTGEEERMRRLFQTCDGDGDGFISRNDLLMVCRQLNMEESVIEIMHQLGADEHGKISFQDFTRCRMQLVREIRKEEVELSVKFDDSCKKKTLRDRIASWPTSSNNSLGALSGARESWEYDSGARDLHSPDLHSCSTLQKPFEYGRNTMNQQVALQRLLTQATNLSNSVGGSYLELANTDNEKGHLPLDTEHSVASQKYRSMSWQITTQVLSLDNLTKMVEEVEEASAVQSNK